jgi:hypothetical protein
MNMGLSDRHTKKLELVVLQPSPAAAKTFKKKD